MMMALERDNQRAKMWKAIAAVDIQHGTPIRNMEEVVAFVNKIKSRAALVKRYGGALTDYFEIKDGRGRGAAVGGSSFITIPVRQRTTIYVLRAMAYTILARLRRQAYGIHTRSELHNRNAAWHGWEYAAIVMDLFRYGLGVDEADALKQEYTDQKIKWRETKKRSLTDEDTQRLVERGIKLAALMKDRRQRIQFIKLYPDAKLGSPDEFTDPYWETLYRIWR